MLSKKLTYLFWFRNSD